MRLLLLLFLILLTWPAALWQCFSARRRLRAHARVLQLSERRFTLERVA
jgi:hypothetical protein